MKATEETWCPICGHMIGLTPQGGLFYTHGPRKNPCPASRCSPQAVKASNRIVNHAPLERTL